MNDNIREKKYKKGCSILVYLFICIGVFYLNNNSVYAYQNTIKTIEGPKVNNNEIVVKKSKGVYEVNMPEKKFPSEVSWTWEGQGQVWACVKYSDKNVIYYLMGDSEVPKINNSTFIDSNGIPRVIVPKIFKVPEGKVNFNLINAYYKYYGTRAVNVENISFYVNTQSNINIKDFEFSGYKDKISQEEEISLNEEENKLHLGINIPQGNSKDCYMIKNKISPIEISLRTLVDKDTKGYLKLSFPNGTKINSFNNDKIQFLDNHTLKLPIDACKGYYEEKIIIMASVDKPGMLQIETALGDEVKKISKNIKIMELNEVKNKISVLEEGIYPLQDSDHETTLKKELKNNIKVKQNISDSIHRFIGTDEKYDNPAGLISGVFKNSSEFDIPVHVKFSVLDDKGKEITYFRGEHYEKEEEFKSVPETNMVVKANSTMDLKMPIFADVYSVKPGKYKGQMTVSFFGCDCDLVIKEFDLYVHKESQLQKIIGVAAIILSILCLILLYVKQKKWTKDLRTSEVMLIALFTTVKFSLVDVSYFVMGDVMRAILGPLGPFMHLLTGIFWDVINSLFVVALVLLVSKPGVIIISTIVRLILKGIAFGTFNPVAILLMLSYAVIAETLLYLAGFTSGKREFEINFKVFAIVALIFGIQNCYSTYTFYYIWMYLYRLFYPSWYININAIFSVIYSIVGSISGIYLGKRLKKVMD